MNSVLSKSTFSGIIIALLSAIAFGLYPPAAKMAYAEGGNSTFVIIATTFARAAILSCYCLVKGQRLLPKPGKWRVTFTGGFFQALSIFGIISSLRYLPGPIMIIILFSHTIMLLFFLAYKGEIRLTRLAVLTTLCALLGLSFVLDAWSQDSHLSLLGLGLALIGAIATMSRLYIFGKQVLTLPPAVVGAQTFSMALLFIVLLALVEKPVPPATALGLFWTLVCCMSLAAGSFGTFFGIAILGSFRWSLFLKFEPIFTAFFSVLILNEILQLSQYFGMLLVLGSLVTYQIFESRTKTVPAALIVTDPESI